MDIDRATKELRTGALIEADRITLTKITVRSGNDTATRLRWQ
jgi:hypothetical protein